jgi:hypothetical protein
MNKVCSVLYKKDGLATGTVLINEARLYVRSLMGKCSYGINDSDLIQKHTSDPEFPFLVSFPRTGSHWLRMVMEQYLGIPSLIRVFYRKNRHASVFSCLHTHDNELSIERRNVIYLYRNPVQTVFSQMGYYKENYSDDLRIQFWSEHYARHLQKWLIEEKCTDKKTVLTYEGMQHNPDSEFEKLFDHFGAKFNPRKLHRILSDVSKKTLLSKAKHNTAVITLSDSYESNRSKFISEKTDTVMNAFGRVDSRLAAFFAGDPYPKDRK